MTIADETVLLKSLTKPKTWNRVKEIAFHMVLKLYADVSINKIQNSVTPEGILAST